ncbi:MAG TPA: hypothetical protein VHZ52_08295 [Acidobacteriaceae bacterium]|nr:hypothetical protein [Acidobacteriaceae bacterium]
MNKRTSPNLPADQAVTGASVTAVLDPPSETSSLSLPVVSDGKKAPSSKASSSPRKQRSSMPTSSSRPFVALPAEDHASNHQAELFYLQKQIQLQTQMVFILEDGARIQGVVEWYDRNSIKVRGKSRVLIYKSAIKYLFKAGEVGSGPGE